MGIVDCASDVNDQQDPRIQNISDPDELSKQGLAIQLGKNLQIPNNQAPQVQVHMIFYYVDLEKHFTKKRMSHLHRYCLSQKLLQKKYTKKRKKKSIIKGADKYPRQR